ncbi:MAG: glycosyltransferase [Phycisphaerales bacterium]|nr:glycosyltransferase [Phycisphaerales bacterium]
MKIAMLSWESMHSIAVGGIAPHVTELASALHLRGHDVHIFTRRHDGQKRYERIGDVHYHRCAYVGHEEFTEDMARMADSFAWHLGEVEYGYGEPFDIVHGHDWMITRALVRLKNERHRPAVMTIHSTEYGRCGNELFWHGQSKRIRDLEWEGAYVADRVICVSESLRKEVSQLYTLPEDKTLSIYNGVNASRFDAPVDVKKIRRSCAVNADEPCVLFAGRLAWQKGPDMLLDAVPSVLERRPKVKFVFAGEGEMRSQLEAQAAAAGIARSVRFVGYRTGQDLVGLFKSADLVCVPSRNEPFGIVILEAWSASKPVVATRTGGPAEFVRHLDTGWTVSSDVESIGDGLEAVLADDDHARRMGVNGRREAETRFSWNTIAAQTEGVYLSVLGRKASTLSGPHAELEVESVMARIRSTKEQQGNGSTAPPPNPDIHVGRTTPPGVNTGARKRSATETKVAAPPLQRGESSRTTIQAASRKSATLPSSSVEPTAEQIRRRAYEIFLSRNGTPGDPASDWVQAERELRERLCPDMS